MLSVSTHCCHDDDHYDGGDDGGVLCFCGYQVGLRRCHYHSGVLCVDSVLGSDLGPDPDSALGLDPDPLAVVVVMMIVVIWSPCVVV